MTLTPAIEILKQRRAALEQAYLDERNALNRAIEILEQTEGTGSTNPPLPTSNFPGKEDGLEIDGFVFR